MALPARIDTILAPIVMYAPGSPPAQVMINTISELQAYVPALASALANDASGKSGANVARTLAYNMLTSNNWNNQEYTKAVQLAADILMLKLRKGNLQAPYMGIEESAEQASSFYSSELTAIFPELRSYLSPQAIDAANQNMGVFNEVKREINSIMHGYNPQYSNQHPPQYQPPVDPRYQQPPFGIDQRTGFPMEQPGQYQGNPPMPMYDSYTGRPISRGPVNTYQPAGSSSDRWSEAMTKLDPSRFPPATDSRYGNDTRTYGSQEEMPPQGNIFKMAHPIAENKTYKASDWKTTPAQKYRTMIPSEGAKAVYMLKDTAITEIIEIGEGAMDREKHKLVLVGNHELDNSSRQQAFVKDIAKFNKVTVNEVRESLNTTERVDLDCYLHKVVMMEPTLEDLILNTRIAHRREKTALYRSYCIIGNLEVCDEDYRSVIETLKTSKTFKQLAYSVKFMISGGSINVDKLFYINQVNKILTKLINSFIGNNISIKGLIIEDFSEDIESLEDYLHNKYGKEYSNAFKSFEAESMEAMFDNCNDEMWDFLISSLKHAEDTMSLNLIPVPCTITSVSMSSSELQVNVIGTDPLLIRESLYPELYVIAKSIFDHSSVSSLSTLENILVTQDGCKYRIYRGYLENNAYLIGNY